MESKNLFPILFLSILFLTFLIPIISAQIIYEVGTNATLKIPCILNGTLCSGSATCNITIININPESFTLISNKEMINDGGFFYYDLNTSQTSIVGEYSATATCFDGDYKGYSTFEYKITNNGREEPSGAVVVFFSIAFILIIGGLAYFFISGLGHFLQLDYDLGDLIKNISLYFVLIATYFLSEYYLGNALVNDITVWVMGITGFTNVAIGLLAFIISFMFGNTINPKEED